VAINSADKIFDESGELTDDTTKSQLELMATQVLTFARSAGGAA
jgi:FMN reductase